MTEREPDGWKLVPVKMTIAMLEASKRAMKDYIDRLPQSERHKMSRKNGGVGVDAKHEMRYRAALAAAPLYANGATTLPVKEG